MNIIAEGDTLTKRYKSLTMVAQTFQEQCILGLIGNSIVEGDVTFEVTRRGVIVGCFSLVNTQVNGEGSKDGD